MIAVIVSFSSVLPLTYYTPPVKKLGYAYIRCCSISIACGGRHISRLTERGRCQLGRKKKAISDPFPTNQPTKNLLTCERYGSSIEGAEQARIDGVELALTTLFGS